MTEYERGKLDGRNEVIAFLKEYAVTLASKENRGGILAAITRSVGSQACNGLAEVIEGHFAKGATS